MIREKSTSYYLNKHIHCYDSERGKKFILKGSNLAKIYGLIKVHKNINPMHPIVFMIGTQEYKIIDCLKVAKICPIFNKGDPFEFNKYKTISLLLTFQKFWKEVCTKD